MSESPFGFDEQFGIEVDLFGAWVRRFDRDGIMLCLRDLVFLCC